MVEGRYDKNALSQVVDTLILETAGFGIFKDRDQMALLRRAAERRGLIVLTDSDGAGFVIRSRIKSCIPGQYLKHAYIRTCTARSGGRSRGPGGQTGSGGDAAPGADPVPPTGGATFLEEGGTCAPSPGLTKADLYAAGLSGRPDSGARRLALLRRLELPEHLTANGLLAVLNACYGAGEAEEILFSEAPAAAGREAEEKKEKIFPKTLDNSAQFAIITFVLARATKEIAGLCKGSTTDSDSVCEGSNPSPAAKQNATCFNKSHFFWGLLPLTGPSFGILMREGSEAVPAHSPLLTQFRIYGAKAPPAR